MLALTLWVTLHFMHEICWSVLINTLHACIRSPSIISSIPNNDEDMPDNYNPTNLILKFILMKKFMQFTHVWARAYITWGHCYIHHYSPATESKRMRVQFSEKGRLAERRGGWRESQDAEEGDGEGQFRPTVPPSWVPIHHLLSEGSSELEIMARLPYSAVQPDFATLAKPRFDFFRQI